MHSGDTVDVKGTKYHNGRLLSPPSKIAVTTYTGLVLVAEVEGDSCTFVGVARTEDLLDERHATDLGHGPTRAMEQGELFDLDDAPLAPIKWED